MDSNKSYLKFKTDLGRQHKVDLANDDHLNVIDGGWEASYCQRALCVRIFCFEDTTVIDRIKFITNEENSHEDPGYKWVSPPTLDTAGCSVDKFYEFVRNNIGEFPGQCELDDAFNSEYWSVIMNHIEWLDLRYERGKWKSRLEMTKEEMKIELDKMTREQRKYVSHFEKALKCNMLNGQAKEWIRSLFDNIYSTSNELSDLEAHFFAPSTFCRTNTFVETIIGKTGDPVAEMFYDAPCSGCSSNTVTTMRSNLSSLSFESEGSIGSTDHKNVTTQKVVPDYVVALSEHPGMFPLVVELKPERKEEEGHIQNIQQMLSKLFFQDAIFGLVVSPRHYQMSLIVKTNNGICLKHTTLPLYDEENNAKLDLKNLNILYKFIYCVFKWAMTTKCRLQNLSQKM